MVDQRVYGETVKLRKGHEAAILSNGERLPGEPGAIEITLLTTTKDPGEVSAEEILAAVRGLLEVEDG